jgi:hypothetical protein
VQIAGGMAKILDPGMENARRLCAIGKQFDSISFCTCSLVAPENIFAIFSRIQSQQGFQSSDDRRGLNLPII